jgi:hydrogenase maturation protease
MSYGSSVNGFGPGGSPTPSGSFDTLVIGLGNPILGDDGVGWRVAEAVRALKPGVEVDCLALGGLSLMERLIGYKRVIIVDALQTREGQVGDVTVLPLQALPDYSAGHTTAAHDTSLQTALRLGRSMGAELPEEIVVVGVEARRVYEFSDELSPAVAAAIPEATQAVLDVIEARKD